MGNCKAGRTLTNHQRLPFTVSTYVARAKLAGLSSPLPPECDDAALERLLFPPS